MHTKKLLFFLVLPWLTTAWVTLRILILLCTASCSFFFLLSDKILLARLDATMRKNFQHGLLNFFIRAAVLQRKRSSAKWVNPLAKTFHHCSCKEWVHNAAPPMLI